MKISRSLSPLLPAYGIVTYHDVPVYRCQAWALELAHYHGEKICLLSGIRDDDVIAAHNRQFHTSLHGQAYLVRMHSINPRHFAPANSPQTTSHCGHADGNPFYGPAGSVIPKIKRGLDFCDNDEASRVVKKLNDIGIPAKQPYDSGSELHHASLDVQNVNKLRRRYTKLWRKGFKP